MVYVVYLSAALAENRRMLCFLGLAPARPVGALACAGRFVAVHFRMATDAGRRRARRSNLCCLWGYLHSLCAWLALDRGGSEARSMGFDRRGDLAARRVYYPVGAASRLTILSILPPKALHNPAFANPV